MGPIPRYAAREALNVRRIWTLRKFIDALRLGVKVPSDKFAADLATSGL
jgi:hypothetical protein